jgi:hypothetical protein
MYRVHTHDAKRGCILRCETRVRSNKRQISDERAGIASTREEGDRAGDTAPHEKSIGAPTCAPQLARRR